MSSFLDNARKQLNIPKPTPSPFFEQAKKAVESSKLQYTPTPKPQTVPKSTPVESSKLQYTPSTTSTSSSSSRSYKDIFPELRKYDNVIQNAQIKAQLSNDQLATISRNKSIQEYRKPTIIEQVKSKIYQNPLYETLPRLGKDIKTLQSGTLNKVSQFQTSVEKGITGQKYYFDKDIKDPLKKEIVVTHDKYGRNVSPTTSVEYAYDSDYAKMAQKIDNAQTIAQIKIDSGGDFKKISSEFENAVKEIQKENKVKTETNKNLLKTGVSGAIRGASYAIPYYGQALLVSDISGAVVNPVTTATMLSKAGKNIYGSVRGKEPLDYESKELLAGIIGIAVGGGAVKSSKAKLEVTNVQKALKSIELKGTTKGIIKEWSQINKLPIDTASKQALNQITKRGLGAKITAIEGVQPIKKLSQYTPKIKGFVVDIVDSRGSLVKRMSLGDIKIIYKGKSIPQTFLAKTNYNLKGKKMSFAQTKLGEIGSLRIKGYTDFVSGTPVYRINPITGKVSVVFKKITKSNLRDLNVITELPKKIKGWKGTKIKTNIQKEIQKISKKYNDPILNRGIKYFEIKGQPLSYTKSTIATKRFKPKINFWKDGVRFTKLRGKSITRKAGKSSIKRRPTIPRKNAIKVTRIMKPFSPYKTNSIPTKTTSKKTRKLNQQQTIQKVKSALKKDTGSSVGYVRESISGVNFNVPIYGRYATNVIQRSFTGSTLNSIRELTPQFITKLNPSSARQSLIKVKSAQKEIVKEIEKSQQKLKSLSRQLANSTSKLLTKTISNQVSKVKQNQQFKLKQLGLTKQIQKQLNNQINPNLKPFKPIFPEETPPIIIGSNDKNFSRVTLPKAIPTYYVIEKVRGKFKKLFPKPLSLQDARDFAVYSIDNNLSKTAFFVPLGKMKQVIRPPKQIQNYFSKNSHKFRPYKIRFGKKKQLVNGFIEKRRFFQDTHGERRQLRSTRRPINNAQRKILLKRLEKARKIRLRNLKRR